MERYKVLELIGEGSFGRVFKATERESGQTVALKLIPKVGHSEREISSLRTEFKIQKELSHPNIVRLLDGFETDKEVISVAEYIPGELYRLFDQYKIEMGYRRLPEGRVQEICGDLLSALHYLHSHRILHRDIKPQNILLDSDGRAKLCDFGFARNLGINTFVLTSIKGTPLYMAPELIEEKPYDHTADIWSVGCIVYELLTGYPPFSTSSLFQLIRKIRYESIQWPGHLSADGQSFLQGVLEKESKRRLTWPELAEHSFVKGRVRTQPEPENQPLTDFLSESQELAKEIQRQDKSKLLPGNSQTLIRVAQKHELEKQKLNALQRTHNLPIPRAKKYKGVRRYSDVGQESAGMLLGRHNPSLVNRRMSEVILPSMHQAQYLTPTQPKPSGSIKQPYHQLPGQPPLATMVRPPTNFGSAAAALAGLPPPPYATPMADKAAAASAHPANLYLGLPGYPPYPPNQTQYMPPYRRESAGNNNNNNHLVEYRSQQPPQPTGHLFSKTVVRPTPIRHQVAADPHVVVGGGGGRRRCSHPSSVDVDVEEGGVDRHRDPSRSNYQNGNMTNPGGMEAKKDDPEHQQHSVKTAPTAMKANKDILNGETDRKTVAHKDNLDAETTVAPLEENLRNLSLDSNETIKNAELTDSSIPDEWFELMDDCIKQVIIEVEESKTAQLFDNGELVDKILSPLINSNQTSEANEKIVQILIIPLLGLPDNSQEKSRYVDVLCTKNVPSLLCQSLTNQDGPELLRLTINLLLRFAFTSETLAKCLSASVPAGLFDRLLSLADGQVKVDVLSLLLELLPNLDEEKVPSADKLICMLEQEEEEDNLELMKTLLICFLSIKKFFPQRRLSRSLKAGVLETKLRPVLQEMNV